MISSLQNSNEVKKEEIHDIEKASEEDQDEHSFLKNVYLQKTAYTIQDKVSVLTDDAEHEPICFMDAL
jgi:hypothetical protein